MCMVSVVLHDGMQTWPGPQEWLQVPETDYRKYLELVEKARKYDEMTNQSNCPDPAKEDWMRRMDDYMKQRYGLEPKA